MRVCYQPTQANPSDWAECDSVDWDGLASFDVMALCVQGVVFEGPDHYAVRDLGNGEVEVAVWHDDPTDWPPGTRWAKVIRFRPLAPDSRPEYGGAINTHQSTVFYAEDEALFLLAYANNPRVDVLPWSDFDPRQPNPMPGKWVSDASYAAHQRRRATAGWRSWTEGLDPSELDASGLLKGQRGQGRYLVPKGTQTFYHNTADLVTGAHNAGNENELGNSPGGSGSESDTAVGTNGKLAFAASTLANFPRSSAWPTTGVYRYQIDATAVGADLTYGLLNQGTPTGHFARMDSGLTADQETFAQDQGAFSGTGLNIASVTDPSWTSGAVSDRFEVLLASVRTSGHGNQTLTLQLGETDDFADGPWAEIAAAVDNAPFFGTNF